MKRPIRIRERGSDEHGLHGKPNLLSGFFIQRFFAGRSSTAAKISAKLVLVTTHNHGTANANSEITEIEIVF